MKYEWRVELATINSLAIRVCVFLLIVIPLIPLRNLVAPADHAGYLEFIAEATNNKGLSGLRSKEYVGLFFYVITLLVPYWVFTNGIFAVYLFLIGRIVKSGTAYVVCLIVTLPMFIHFNYVSKEAILGFVAVGGMLTHTFFGKRYGQTVFFVGATLFACFVRPYYVIPIAACLATCFLGKRLALALASVGLVTSVALIPFPLQVLEQQRIRMYEANLIRFGTRTTYPNVMTESEFPLEIQSLLNYAIVSVESLFPLTWTQSLKDVFAQLFFIALIVLIHGAATKGDKLFAIFGVVVVLTVPFFSPDLGTTIRHCSAAAMIMQLGILVRQEEGTESTVKPFTVFPVYA